MEEDSGAKESKDTVCSSVEALQEVEELVKEDVVKRKTCENAGEVLTFSEKVDKEYGGHSGGLFFPSDDEGVMETQPLSGDPLDMPFRSSAKRKAIVEYVTDAEVEFMRAQSKLRLSLCADADAMPEEKNIHDSETLKKYADHCAAVDSDPDTQLMKLSFEEFLCQSAVDENEFGPSEDYNSILVDALNSRLPEEEQLKHWKLRHNRFVEVLKMKQKKKEEENVHGDKAEKE